MSAAELIAALELPAGCRVDRRVPKTLLLEHGAPTPADKRHINEGIEEVQWIAALKPSNVAVPEYRDKTREYLEIPVIRLTLREDASATRLVELVHRAVPYPVMLVSDTAGSRHVGASVAHKRWSQGEAGRTVLDGGVAAAEVNDTDDERQRAFRNAIALRHQPHATMYDLYHGWTDAVIALRVALVTGIFVPAVSRERATDRLEALREYERLDAEIERVRVAAAKERQVSRQVELNVALKSLEAARAAARTRL